MMSLGRHVFRHKPEHNHTFRIRIGTYLLGITDENHVQSTQTLFCCAAARQEAHELGFENLRDPIIDKNVPVNDRLLKLCTCDRRCVFKKDYSEVYFPNVNLISLLCIMGDFFVGKKAHKLEDL